MDILFWCNGMNMAKAGLLSNDNELIQDFKNHCGESECYIYKSIDSLKVDEYNLLTVDYKIFETPDVAQFLFSKIRKKIHDIPVLLILQGQDVSNIDFNWFFNDFILYPFRKHELYARLQKIVWDKGIDEEVISIGHIKINLKQYVVYLHNEKIDLIYKEFELLRILVQNKGMVFSRQELLKTIWGVEYIGGTRTVDVHIRRLRGKLGEEFNSIIETVRNVGYKCKE